MDARQRERLESGVIELFKSGLPPSQIDKAMHLVKGTSRLMVIRWWREMDEDDVEESGGFSF